MLNQISQRSISCTPKLRARLIKFRYGVRNEQHSAAAQHSGSQTGKSGKTTQPGESIWDFQIPARWRRKPLDEQEIAVINNGGPL